jgi:hypothetical protein
MRLPFVNERLVVLGNHSIEVIVEAATGTTDLTESLSLAIESGPPLLESSLARAIYAHC